MSVSPLPSGNHRPLARVRTIGLGPAGCAAINYLVAMGAQSNSLVAVSGDSRELEHCNAATKVLFRTGMTVGGIAILKLALEGADLVVIAGSTDEGAATVVLRAARMADAAVARVVSRPFPDDPLGAIAMTNEILAEHNAWMAGDVKGRAAPPDVPLPR